MLITASTYPAIKNDPESVQSTFSPDSVFQFLLSPQSYGWPISKTLLLKNVVIISYLIWAVMTLILDNIYCMQFLQSYLTKRVVTKYYAEVNCFVTFLTYMSSHTLYALII